MTLPSGETTADWCLGYSAEHSLSSLHVAHALKLFAILSNPLNTPHDLQQVVGI